MLSNNLPLVFNFEVKKVIAKFKRSDLCGVGQNFSPLFNKEISDGLGSYELIFITFGALSMMLGEFSMFRPSDVAVTGWTSGLETEKNF